MKCPKCGYRRQTRDNAFVPATECPACGVVYSKHEIKAPAGPVRTASPTPPNLRPSPVDEASLRKARDRVEKRLRQRLQNSAHDDRHEQTLKLARRFTEEEIRKRRLQFDTEADSSAEATEAPMEENPETEQETAKVETMEASQTAESINDPALEADNATPTESARMLDDDTAEPVLVAAGEELSRADAPVPEHDDDSDVKTETVILTSSQPMGTFDAPVTNFDSTPIETASPQEEVPQSETADPDTNQAPATKETVNIASLTAFSNLSRRGQGFVNMLTAAAWLILGAGVIGAILSWTTIRNVEAGMNIPVPESLSSLPLGLLLGFAYLATGALGFAFFWVSSTINRQLKDIRRLLMLQPGIVSLTEGTANASDEAGNEDPLKK